MIDPLRFSTFCVLVRVLLCPFRRTTFLLKMVTTRAMSRQLQKGGSVSSSSSPVNAVLQSEAAVNLETELRIAAATFPPFPRSVFRTDETWSSLRMNASYGHPSGKSAGDITSSSIPRPRSHLRDPRLKAAMAKVLARVDGVSAHRSGVFKARAPPLTTAVVASILHKVDNDLRKIPEGQEVSSVGTGPSPGARFEWKMGPRSDWFESETGVVALQDQKSPFPCSMHRLDLQVSLMTTPITFQTIGIQILCHLCRCGKLSDMLTSKMTSMSTWAKPWLPRRSSRPARLTSGIFKSMFRVLGIIWLLRPSRPSRFL